MEEPSSHDHEREESQRTEGLAARLRRLVGQDVDPEVTLDAIEGDPPSAASTVSDAVLERLQAHGLKESRYVLKGEVARGGMGVILKAWDEDLRRDLAMKVVIDRKTGEGAPAGEIEPRTLCRFLEEAQITGQLDHPGVVPVHELGLDAAGHVYFTMRLIKGRTLKHVFDLVHDGEGEWTIPRALGVLMKVCETMAYAHAKGVIHRDLKPANVMVGRFGEVYVMDWGLARVIGAEDRHDIRINRELMSTPLSVVQSERRADGETSDEALVTMDGDIVGTPAYISPEQGRGEVATLDARTDVYSMGCMLYQLIAGQVPFMPSGARIGPHMLLMRVLEGPPKPLTSLAPDAPAELIAICEKAMSREPKDRYWTADDLAADLHAFLERRVVRAYESGAVAEIRKWVVRNKLAAAASFLALAAIIGGLAAKSEVEARGKRELDFSTDSDRARAAIADADEPWPSHPDWTGHFEDWLARARELVTRRGHHERRHADFEASMPALPSTDLRLELERQRELLANLDRLEGEAGEVRRMEERLQYAREVEQRTVSGPEAKAAWNRAAAAIASSPLYGGLRLEPQLGLIPLAPDPASGLWEFALPETGALPQRDEDSGRWRITEDSCLVLVLVPTSTFRLGAQKEDPKGPNYDEQARDDEWPMKHVTVPAFFLSKYEMTQAQWLRIWRDNPSTHLPGGVPPTDLTHPVESVSWATVRGAMDRLGLDLPSETQWECACRAGTTSPWSTGSEATSLALAANVVDLAAKESEDVQIAARPEDWNDGFPATAPVGSFEPNDWGLHDMHGNVSEWTGDPYTPRYDAPPSERLDMRCVRGGSWIHQARIARSAARYGVRSDFEMTMLGLRPARAIDH